VPNHRLDIAYDGSGFFGYAKQPNVRTVQGVLETALEPYTGGAITYVAGRTDKGVHASSQVVSFNCGELDTARVLRSLNKQLAPEIAAHTLAVVDEKFHARFSATGRAYRYRIRNASVHDPLTAHTMWTVTRHLDVDLMNRAVAQFVGEHDFAALCRKFEDKSMTRTVVWAQWRRKGDRLDLSIGAHAFCHQMVRSVVALCVEVGLGDRDPEDITPIIAGKDRGTIKGVLAPPRGLSLVAVAYDHDPVPRPGWAE
jgi:tRNA pseudouridine38-40 synthase